MSTPPADSAGSLPRRLRALVVVTRGEAGGAQVHVLELVRGLRGEVDFTVALGEEGFLADALAAEGVAVRLVPDLQRSVALGADLRAVRALVELCRRVRPDLVHTHSTKAGLLGRAAARVVGVPALHTAHAWSFSDGLAWSRKAVAVPVEALAGRVTARFIVVSEADGAIARRYRVASPAQLRVVHNGVADVACRSRPAAGDPPVVVMVARLASPKDPQLLLEALAAVRTPWRLRLVGDGPDRAAVEGRVRALGLTDRVVLEGTRDDVPEILAQSHVFALVSRQEGLPLSILEAMRAGLPVVASDVGGVREAVQAGVTGALVARGDAVGLARSLEALLTDPAARASQGAAGRRAFEARFTAERMIAGTRSVYAEVARAGVREGA